MNDPIVVTRTLVKRAWGDVEPKVGWAFASGAAASFVLGIAQAYGVEFPPIISQNLPYAFAIIGAYVFPSVGQTVTTTKHTASGAVQEQEKHTGNAVSVFTAPTPVQATAVAPQAKRASFTDVVEDTFAAQDEKPTEVIPGTLLPEVSRASQFLSTLPSASSQPTGPQSIDGH